MVHEKVCNSDLSKGASLGCNVFQGGGGQRKDPADGKAEDGSAVSSTMWYPNVGALSRTFRVYAPDIIGEMGKSVRTSLMTKAVNYIDWMMDLIDGLRLEQMQVVGPSLGGFLAIQLALSAPQRVAKLVQLSPATLCPIRPMFYLRMAAAILVPFLSSAARQALFLGIATANAAPAIKQLMTPTDFQYKMFFPPVTSDDELRQIRAATLLLLGEKEVIHRPQTALKRAMRLIPHNEVRSFLVRAML